MLVVEELVRRTMSFQRFRKIIWYYRYGFGF
ncbi:hypothetical protein ES332_A05G330900v1 [Gossypium tomentosum]|uniref:Uncharacterized protein n=1 Tax=Gossypium tomentosum TaxID=34277 RepID=A0A5D2QQL7_GOSTO|nr:hypothetical protein ES332_A05G330900v1 [Gossypium tomentosum]